ncbi:Chromobox protein 8 [Mactra antiquata]
MADRVFIADYIKKKRRRKGNIEYLVKWKGYPTRHCTWEPQENILDNSLIRQFDEEGYDPRRVRAACRKKKRRRSEITEARSLTLPFSDSDSEHERTSHDLLSTHENKVSPVSLSKYGGVWQTDAPNQTLDTLFENETETGSEQKNRDANIDNKENANWINESSKIDGGTVHKNGGKSCHPKMRAKFMFRSGDFENVDWGSCNEWSSSDNESTRSVTNKDLNPDIYGLSRNSYENPAKRRRLSTFSLDMSSTASESTIPAIDELESPTTNKNHDLNIDIPSPSHVSTLAIDTHSTLPEFDYRRPNSCPYLESSFTPEPSPEVLEHTPTMPTLTNETLLDESDELSLKQTTVENVESQICVTDDKKTRDNVFVTEVTLENLTVIIQECERTKGFFKWES